MGSFNSPLTLMNRSCRQKINKARAVLNDITSQFDISIFQIGKGVRQGCILSSCLFNLYTEYIMRSSGLNEAQAGIKIAGRNINNLRYADDTTLMAEGEGEVK